MEGKVKKIVACVIVGVILLVGLGLFLFSKSLVKHSYSSESLVKEQQGVAVKNKQDEVELSEGISEEKQTAKETTSQQTQKDLEVYDLYTSIVNQFNSGELVYEVEFPEMLTNLDNIGSEHIFESSSDLATADFIQEYDTVLFNQGTLEVVGMYDARYVLYSPVEKTDCVILVDYEQAIDNVGSEALSNSLETMPVRLIKGGYSAKEVDGITVFSKRG